MVQSLARRVSAPLLVIIVLVAMIPVAFYTGQQAAGGSMETVTRTLTQMYTITVTQAPRSQTAGQSPEESSTNVFIVDNGVVRPASWESIDILLSEVYGEVQYKPPYRVGAPEGVPLAVPATVVTPQIGMEAPAKEAPDTYSRTNVRVAGVDEPDVVKINGTHAFIVLDDTIYYAKIWPPEEMSILGNITLKEMLEDVKLDIVVAYNVSGTLVPVSVLESWWFRLEGIYLDSSGALIALVRESGQWVDRAIIVKYRPGEGVVGTLWVTGSLVDSRLLNDTLIVVTNQEATQMGSRPIVNGAPPSPESIALTGTPQAYVNVLKVNTSTLEYSYVGILGPRARAIYLTLEGVLYIAQPSWGGPTILVPSLLPAEATPEEIREVLAEMQAKGPVTMITRVNALVPRVEVSTVLDGRVHDTWRIDEYRGYLRVVADWVKRDAVSLYVLNATTLELVSRLDSISVNEDVYGVRFMGDMVYLVTFRRVDPLFAINLSDPTNPSIIGYLKAPGFDDYLHPLPGGLLLGIGYENVRGSQLVRISIYNLSINGTPQPLDRLYIEGLRTWTPVLEIPKGYRILDLHEEKWILTIPVIISEATKSTRGYAVIQINLTSASLNLKDIIYLKGGEGMIRAFHVGDILYIALVRHIMETNGIVPGTTVTRDLVIRAYSLDTLQKIGEVSSLGVPSR